MPSPYYPFMSLTGRGRYFFPLEAKKQRSKKRKNNKKKRLISGYVMNRSADVIINNAQRDV